MRYASLFLNFESVTSSHISIGKKAEVVAEKILQNFTCQEKLNPLVYTAKFVESKGVKLRVDHVIEISNEADETPVFALIKKIILNGENVLIGYQRLSNLGFDDQYYAFKVEYENVFFIEPVNFNVTPKYIFEATENCKFVNCD